jgi:uncharacterized protein YyaL (SSP411 family)
MTRLQRICLALAFLALVGGLAGHFVWKSEPVVAEPVVLAPAPAATPATVEWRGWDAGLAEAKAENRLIFVHLGYPLAAGCRLMDETTFMDAKVRHALRRDFVPVRVNRQERPDIDAVVSRLMARLAGQTDLPVNLILTPEGLPLHGTTLVDANDRGGQPGLARILGHYASAWHRDPQTLREAGRKLLARGLPTDEESNPATAPLSSAWLHRAYWQATTLFDAAHGGFGSGSKTLHPEVVRFLIRYHRLYPDTAAGRYAREMALRTLDRGLAGALEDREEGGFFRYCSDSHWRTPQPEKLLSDQARIALALLDAYALTEDVRYAEAVQRTLNYMLGGLLQDNGLFIAGERIEVVSGDIPGHSRVNIAYTVTRDQQTTRTNIRLETYNAPSSGEVRRATLSPSNTTRDNSTLTSWNGLVLSALARAAAVMPGAGYLEQARALAAAIDLEAAGNGTRLVHKPLAEESHVFAQDYAWVIAGLLDLHAADGDGQWLVRAMVLQEEMDRLFWDESQGGYSEVRRGFTPFWDVPIIQVNDGFLPGTNAVAARNLARSGQLLGAMGYWHRAGRMLRHALPRTEAYPLASASLMTVCADYLDSGFEWSSDQRDLQESFFRDRSRAAPTPEFPGQVEHGLIFLGGGSPE